MDEKKVAYCYIKGDNYTKNQFHYDGDDLLNEVDLEYEDDVKMLLFVSNFSNIYSIPVQFYY